MTRLFLAAGVAALAIASAASAKPGGGGGGGNPHGDGGGNPHGGGAPAYAPQGGGGGGNPHGDGGGRGRGGGGGDAGPVFMGGGGGHGHGGGGGFAAQQMQRFERPQFRAPEMRAERQQARGFERQQFRAPEMRAERQQAREQARSFERQQSRGFERQQQARNVERQNGQWFARQQERMAAQAARGNAVQQRAQNAFAATSRGQAARVQQVQQQVAANNPAVAQRIASFNNAANGFNGNGTRGLIDGCPPGLWMKNNGCMPPGQAAKLLGTSFAAASAAVPLSALPQPLTYLYPDTPDYYYRYGDGYLYQVNRGTNLIDSLLPLIGGGYVPGQYLPQPYMASYVPDAYGLNSFYPDYGDVCNRYANGVIYEVDCATGYVEDVVPMYAGGYGVGQMLPSAYGYYNVPMQYRSMYYDTPDYGYWYAPGAIYQYDQRTSLITSVAALMAPGFSVGQPLPAGYGVYNVPYDYRSTYYDTPNAWYRYNNGYIYQVDPVTQIVTAIVASLLT